MSIINDQLELDMLNCVRRQIITTPINFS